MSSASAHWRDRLDDELAFDKGALGLVALFLFVHLATVAAVVYYQGIGFAAEGPPGVDGGSASTGAALAVVEVGFAVVMLGIIVAWRYLPEWVRDIVKGNVVLFLALLYGAILYAAGSFWGGTGVILGAYTGLKVLDEFDLWWSVNNILALALAIAVAARAATWFGPAAVIVALLGLTAYDYYFADKNDWMFSLGEGIMRLRIPVLFVVPTRLRVDWEYIVKTMGDGKDEKDLLSWGIGTADLLLPALFAGAVAYSGDVLAGGATTWAVAGVIGGTVLACLRMRQKMLTKGAGAGLPPLAAGAVGGYLVMALPWVVVG